MGHYYDLINEELERLSHDTKGEQSENIGMLTIKSVNRTLNEASQRPDPKALWLTLWYEGEVCCLFSDSNLGKSIYATQIATKIAETQKVLLFDFELSDKQFQLRYTDEGTKHIHTFPEELYRVEINRDYLNTSDFEDKIIKNIESAAIQTGAKVLIVDNLTYLSTNLEKGSDAGSLMFALTGLKKKYDLSILVLAHTPKRPLHNPITQNDLGGSKKLYNFFDSVFAIGRSAKDSDLRYIKQLKVRYGTFKYDADNVILAYIDKPEGYLHFNQIGFDAERAHLIEQSDNTKDDQVKKCKEMSAQGKSQREIAKELNISPMTVGRYLKK